MLLKVIKVFLVSFTVTVLFFCITLSSAHDQGEHTSFLLNITRDSGSNNDHSKSLEIQRAMNYLSEGYSDKDRALIRRKIKENGGNVAYIFLSNQGDGTPANINPFSSWQTFGDINTLELKKLNDQWKPRIQTLIDDDLEPIFWLLADDSPKTSEVNINGEPTGNIGRSELESYFRTIVAHFDGMAKGYVIGLEVDEYLNVKIAHYLAKVLNEITNNSIGVHLSKRRATRADFNNVNLWTGPPDIDTYYHQYGFNKTSKEIKSDTEFYLIRLRPSLRFVASEYCLASTTETCQALGKAAMAGGAMHTGNGRQ